MNWDNIEIKETNSVKTEFMSFPEGSSTIRIVSPPLQRKGHWLQSAKVSVDCLGSNCPVCEMNRQAEKMGEQPPSKIRNSFMFYVIDRADGQVKIVEQGINFIKTLKSLQEQLREDGVESNLQLFDLKVRRTGSTAQNTSYVLRESKPTELTQEDIAKVAAVKPITEVPLKPNQEQMIALLQGKSVKDAFSSGSSDETIVDFTK